MLLEQTLFQLDIGPVPPEQAAELGALGYLQWLAGLPGHVCYPREARRALGLAKPFIATSPAVAVFCDLLLASLRKPMAPVSLATPVRGRRGGAPARRRQRMI